MCNNRHCNFNACGFFGVGLSILFGAIIGILFAFGFIPNIVTDAWIAFGLGVLTLILLVVDVFLSATNPSSALSKCLRKNIICLLVSVFGTIIFAIAALSFILIPIFIVIILVAIGAFFFSLMLIELIALILCVVCKIDSRDNDEC